ncbi:hypothetical protein BJ742DRAFT_274766 [Cladochytrium replicatum]|nr:hypothetical protein BJ742DRAFT_274766 [Cladochytrium replicatum]
MEESRQKSTGQTVPTVIITNTSSSSLKSEPFHIPDPQQQPTLFRAQNIPPTNPQSQTRASPEISFVQDNSSTERFSGSRASPEISIITDSNNPTNGQGARAQSDSESANNRQKPPALSIQIRPAEPSKERFLDPEDLFPRKRTSVRVPPSSTRAIIFFTRRVPQPKKSEVVREKRFIVRLCQLIMAIASFVCLASAAFDVNYSSAIIAFSGINLNCLTSLSSMFVSYAGMFVYFFPVFLGIPPHRHPRFSRVEICVDLIYCGFWLFASSTLAFFGRCPHEIYQTLSGTKSNSTPLISPRLALTSRSVIVKQWNIFTSLEKNIFGNTPTCLPWNLCMVFGYICSVLFAVSFAMGARDQWKNGGKSEGHVWMPRGTWDDNKKVSK